MPPKSNVPIRICGSKTRAGCKTCKRRHVKCDERQPVCLRCQKGNRSCVYEVSPPSTTPSNRITGSGGSGRWVRLETIGATQPDQSISPYGPYDVSEVIAVKHFTAHLGRELAGCFSDELWCRMLPRVAHYEPAIWNAIVALSSLDSSARIGGDGAIRNPASSVAVSKYSKAITELNARLVSTPSTLCKDVVLLSCVLFAIFETLQNRFDSALKHIYGGMRLLIEWTHEARSNGQNLSGMYLDRTILQPIFLLLDSQAIQMGAVGFRQDCSLPALTEQLCIPTSFTTLNEAHLVLVQIFNRGCHWQTWAEPVVGVGEHPGEEWMRTEEKYFLQSVARWDAAFDLLKQAFHPQPATLLLLVQRTVMQVVFEMNAFCGPSELEWDEFTPMLREAVEYAEEYMRLTAHETQAATTSADDSCTPRSVLTLTMEMIMPMFYICAKCRDPVLRRRALVILKTCGRKEGIWDSRACAQIAEKIIELEENAAMENGYIPESARVCGVDVNLDDDYGAELGYKRIVRDEDGSNITHTVHEPISV